MKLYIINTLYINSNKHIRWESTSHMIEFTKIFIHFMKKRVKVIHVKFFHFFWMHDMIFVWKNLLHNHALILTSEWTQLSHVHPSFEPYIFCQLFRMRFVESWPLIKFLTLGGLWYLLRKNKISSWGKFDKCQNKSDSLYETWHLLTQPPMFLYSSP